MDTIPFSIFYIGIPITLISIYIIWNLLRKVERLEDELNTSEDLIESTFKDFDEAVSARKEAEVKYGYHENHGRSEITHLANK